MDTVLYSVVRNELEGLAYAKHLAATVGVGRNDILVGICSRRTLYCMGLDDVRTAFFQVGARGKSDHILFLHEIFHAMGAAHSDQRGSVMSYQRISTRIDRETRKTIENFFNAKTAQ